LKHQEKLLDGTGNATYLLCTFLTAGCMLHMPFLFSVYFLKYSKIPLIQLAWAWIGAKLSSIPHCQTVPVLTSVLMGNFLLLLLHLGCTTNQRSIPCGYVL